MLFMKNTVRYLLFIMGPWWPTEMWIWVIWMLLHLLTVFTSGTNQQAKLTVDVVDQNRCMNLCFFPPHTVSHLTLRTPSSILPCPFVEGFESPRKTVAGYSAFHLCLNVTPFLWNPFNELNKFWICLIYDVQRKIARHIFGWKMRCHDFADLEYNKKK